MVTHFQREYDQAMKLLRFVWPHFRRWAVAVSRGLRLHCPRCGKGRINQGLLRRQPFCSSCCLNWTLDDGEFTGGVYINYAITGVLTFSLFGLMIAFQVPNKLPLLMTFGLVFSLLFHRHAIGMYMAILFLNGAFQHGPPQEALALEEG